MLRLEDHRPFAVRMADKKLFDHAFPDAFLMLFAKSLDIMPYTDDLFRDLYAPRRIDPIFPGDEIRLFPIDRGGPVVHDIAEMDRLIRPRTSTFRQSTEVRWDTCSTPRGDVESWIDRYVGESGPDMIVPDYTALEKRVMADVYAEYEKAITGAVFTAYINLDKPEEFEDKRKALAAALANDLVDAVFIDLAGTPGRTYEFPGHGDLILDIYAKKPIAGEVDRKDPKAYLQHDPTKSHKRSKRRRRR